MAVWSPWSTASAPWTGWAHLLCLTATDLGARDPGLPGIQANLDAGAGVRVLDPDDIRLTGNVTGDFAPAPAPF